MTDQHLQIRVEIGANFIFIFAISFRGVGTQRGFEQTRRAQRLIIRAEIGNSIRTLLLPQRFDVRFIAFFGSGQRDVGHFAGRQFARFQQT